MLCLMLSTKYAKFLKKLYTIKCKIKRQRSDKWGKNESMTLQRKPLPKCQHPNSFTVPIRISNSRFEKSYVDLGASINDMLDNIYNSLNLSLLKETDIIIQLEDRTNIYFKGYY